MRVLNLYCGIGGNRKLWPENFKITAIEKNQKIANVYKKLYPMDNVIVCDAHKYLESNFNKFDLIWSSPPCQSHSKMTGQNQKPRYFDLKLYQEIIFLQKYFKGKWVVENVDPYYKPLIKHTFRLGRHLFWSNFQIGFIEPPKAKNFIKSEDPNQLMDWLGIHYEGNIYYDGNHCPAQVLRNAVHPVIGEHVIKFIEEKNLFNQ
jgi:DNA (cytosine-5)-methyltransferase 1